MSAPRRGDPDDDIDFADPGKARERTDLAWTRSAISFAALGVLIGKIRPVAGLPVLIFSAIVWQLGQAPRRRIAASRRILAVTIAISVMALIALVITLAGQGSSGLHL